MSTVAKYRSAVYAREREHPVALRHMGKQSPAQGFSAVGAIESAHKTLNELRQRRAGTMLAKHGAASRASAARRSQASGGFGPTLKLAAMVATSCFVP